MIAPPFLEQLRDMLPVSDVVGARLPLVRAGKEMKACCPFHHEKTPSFFVNDDKAMWHCFGCGAHGDIVGFVMRHDNLSFPEAVETLAGQAGLPMPVVTPEEREAAKRKADLIAIVEEACRFYETWLYLADGARARDYLHARGLDDDTIGRFRLGWAPADGHALRRHLRDQGIEEEEAIAAGVLVRAREKEDGRVPAPYSFMRARIVFPIGDAQGRVVAFGGRIIEGDGPKYLNTAETALFAKGRRLYGQSRARRAAGEGKPVIVVEGYLDVIQAVQAGFDGVVAPLGTALTADQLATIWRMIRDDLRQPILCFDGDAAGLRATRKACELGLSLLEPGRSLRFARLPDTQDPDSLLRDGGADAFQALIDGARPMVEQLWELALLDSSLERPRALDSPDAKAAMQTWVEDRIGTIPDDTVRAAYVSDLERRLKDVLGARPKLKIAKGDKPKAAREAGGDGGTTDGAAATEVENCPILVLGSRDKTYFYLSRRGEYLDLRFDKHADSGIAALFGGDTGWLVDRFPKTDSGNQVVGYQAGAARNFLFRSADALPIFEPETVIRGTGLWPDGEGGIIVHCGDVVRVGGDWLGAGRRIGAHVYPVSARLPAPAAQPGPRDDWCAFHAFVGSWAWKAPDRDCLAQVGWLACAMLAGVVPWNCPQWIIGGSESGKSTLLRLHRVTLGSGWAMGVSDPSVAAVRQMLGPAARPVLIDEIEASEVHSRARDVAQLVRLATDPEQSATRRGSAEGVSVEFPIRAVLYFTSILQPALQHQDLNRMTVCELGALTASIEARERLRARLREFGTLGPRMRARLIARWPCFPAARDAFEAALLKLAHKGRGLDQLGTLLACAFLAVFDTDRPTEREADDWARLFPPDGAGDSGPLREATEPFQCLQHLLTCAPEKEWINNVNRRVTLAEMIIRRVEHNQSTSDLGAYGLAIGPHPKTGVRCLVVANSHQGLEELFRGTRWSGGVWSQALRQIGDDTKADKVLSFRGLKQRGTWLPLSLIPDGRDWAPEEERGRTPPAADHGAMVDGGA